MTIRLLSTLIACTVIGYYGRALRKRVFVPTLPSASAAGLQTGRPISKKAGDAYNGPIHKRHQDHGRPVRPHAARHLLRRKADHQGAPGYDREGLGPTAQAGLSDASARNRKPREATRAGISIDGQKGARRGLPGDR